MSPKTAGNRNKHPPSTPFKIGQPADHVLLVIKKTGREIKSTRIIGPEKIESPTGDLIVQLELSCGTSLVFQAGRDSEGKGNRCYRVTAINQNIKNRESKTGD